MRLAFIDFPLQRRDADYQRPPAGTGWQLWPDQYQRIHEEEFHEHDVWSRFERTVRLGMEALAS